MEKIPKVFVSYSWSNPQHEEKVLTLANRLMSHGVDIILDKWDLKEGHDKHAFMEQAVTNPEIDRVLLICDKVYAEKADKRSGGVGDETTIISSELYGKTKQEKFIPVIFEFDEDGEAYCPAYAKSRIYVDLSTDNEIYENEYEKLLRCILEKPLYRKPALGQTPEWLEDESTDLSQIRDIIRQINGYTGNNKAKERALFKNFVDSYIEAFKCFRVTEGALDGARVVEIIDQMKPIRDLYIDFLEVFNQTEVDTVDVIPELFERLYNETMIADENGYGQNDFEYFKFIIWEMLLCTIAFLYHFEKYNDIYDMATYTYFLKETHFRSSALKAQRVVSFRATFRLIECDYGPKSSKKNLYCYAADILINRERLPIITRESLSFADILLFQLISSFQTEDSDYKDNWYPMCYIYNHTAVSEFRRFVSKRYCEKTKNLFGAKSLDELKDIITKKPADTNVSYSGCFDSCPTILTVVKPEEIASMN